MNFAAALITAMSGGVVFLAAVLTLARAIFRQASSTEANAKAVQQLAEKIGTLSGKIDHLDTRIDDHEVQLAVLRDRGGRPGSGGVRR